MDQKSKEWHESRLGTLGSTSFKDCLSKGQAHKSLIYTKAGEILTGQWREASAASMDWGNQYEDAARVMYEITTGRDVDQVGMVFLPDNMMIGVSPDGLVGDDGGIEIKCPQTAREHIRHMAEGCPRDYLTQIYGMLWVTGRQWWDFVSYHPEMPDRLQLFVTRIERDEPFIQALQDAAISTAREIEAIIDILTEK